MKGMFNTYMKNNYPRKIQLASTLFGWFYTANFALTFILLQQIIMQWRSSKHPN